MALVYRWKTSMVSTKNLKLAAHNRVLLVLAHARMCNNDMKSLGRSGSPMIRIWIGGNFDVMTSGVRMDNSDIVSCLWFLYRRKRCTANYLKGDGCVPDRRILICIERYLLRTVESLRLS